MPEIGEDLIKSMQDTAKAIGLPYKDITPEQLLKNIEGYFKALEEKNYVTEAIKQLQK